MPRRSPKNEDTLFGALTPRQRVAIWVGIAALSIVFFVFGIFVSHDTFIRWGGLIVYTLALYGFLVYDNLRFVRNRRFWKLISIFLIVHFVVFVAILRSAVEWRLPWFFVMILEFPVFNHFRRRLDLDR